MAELVAVPELVDDLLLLQVGGDLSLFGAGDAPFQVVDVRVQLLGQLIRFGPLPFQLQLFIADSSDLGFFTVHIRLDQLFLFQLLLQTFPEALRLALRGGDGVSPCVAVAVNGIEQHGELLG